MPKTPRFVTLLFCAWSAVALPAGAAEAFFTTVERVVDGDTVVLNDGSRVRLIGVDTPELTRSARLARQARQMNRTIEDMERGGKAAADLLRRWLDDKDVRVVFDPANEKSGHKDAYGRTLAYLFVEPDASLRASLPPDVLASDAFSDGFINGLIVLTGYGAAYTRFPYAHRSAFREYEAEARRRGRGLWND